MPNFYRGGKLLVWPREPCTLQSVADNFPLQLRGEHSGLIEQGASPEFVARDRRKMEIWIVKGCERLSGVGDQKLLPDRAFVVLTNTESIRLEALGLRQATEFLIMHSRRFAQRTWCHLSADGGVFVRESTFECQHYVAAALYIIRDAPEYRVRRAIQRRHQQYLVTRKLGVVGRNEVRLHVQVIKRVIHLMEDGQIICVVGEGHIADGVGRVSADQNRHMVVFLEIDQSRAYLLQLTSYLCHLSAGTVGQQVMREHAFPVRFLAIMQR